MRIAMFTNTYLPHVGGVARSVKTLEDACRRFGHEVKVVAPEFDGAEVSEDVLRVPAIQKFNGSDFCVRLPMPNVIRDFIEDFGPDVIHSHHPFLLGDAALRESWKMQVPILFTHHTLYERYTHYVPLDSLALKRMAIQLATEYCNLCDQVIAPSDSIAKLLHDRMVITPIRSIPTGIDTENFAAGDGPRFRQSAGIPLEARVIGHVGRLAREKNLIFLCEAVALRLKGDPQSLFLVVGDGDAREEMVGIFEKAGCGKQVHFAGKKSGQELADAYAAMDWFVFASQTETQGIVLAEAMAAGKPVVALDGPGVREIVEDGANGILLRADAPAEEFASALEMLMADEVFSGACSERARESAEIYTTDHCARQMIRCYEELIESHDRIFDDDPMPWDRLMASVEVEWDLLSAKVSAAAAAVIETPATEASLD
ncbi:glycosyltransferase [Luteolibacter luteus]|uniref:Glycosyltransferase family 4 protein n=1 Tax=Luteolibacter luteus TaxID=2728835 RepID=A0A858RKD5_9BACT|nr:glycosyltransferase [Luteolibacter luteus]QJE97766.1 glycosyltransferase family 4 protein [Luteolibacter luteus]